MQLWSWFRAIVPPLLAAAFLQPLVARAGQADETLEGCVAAIASELGPEVTDALQRMDGLDRRLLALRSYVRSRTHLAERWSWTAAEIAAYEGSSEHHELQQEIERVRAAFAEENPGFELWVNPQVRSLDIQVDHWNTNESVTAAAANLLVGAAELVGAPEFPVGQPARAAAALESFLAAHVPAPTPTVAAPGLSPHGQMRAIDFQVHKDGQVVAGTRTSTIATDWDQAGWTGRLDAAVRAASNRFVGPLATPREPWHYTYTPDAVAAQ